MLRIKVHSGDRDRASTLVNASVPARRLELGSGGSHADGRQILLRDDVTGISVSGQYDQVGEMLSFVVREPLKAGEARVFSIDPSPEPEVEARFQATATSKLDRVELSVGRDRFATYIVDGTRRPYFWPVLGPSGASLVRGQGSADHPHHTGLSLSYGGHSEAGSVNIWSDWDEPPYGPGGRMLHRGFRHLRGGPVFGELVHDLTYVDTDGEPFAQEERTVRWWWASEVERFIDIEARISTVTDRGTRPFIVMIRMPGSFGDAGRTTAAPEVDRNDQARIYHSRWVDASGPTAGPPAGPPPGPPEEHVDAPGRRRPPSEPGTGPWNGIALFDHPSNHGFPNVVGKYATAQQITQAHYPPPDAMDGPFSYRTRILVHDGDAAGANVEALAGDYASGCRVELTE
jgi:hypothetical protein